MTGILRVVDGVVASGANGKIDMHPGDFEAAKIKTLSYNIPTRDLINNGTGTLAGVERAYGSELTSVGTISNWTVVPSEPTLNNKPSLVVDGNANGIRGVPVMTPSASFTLVMVVSFTAAGVSNTVGASQVFSRMGSDNSTIKMSVRRVSGNLVFTPNQAAAASFITTPMSGFVADTPYVLVFEWNNTTHTGIIYKNQLDTPLIQNVNPAVSTSLAEGDRYDFLAAGNGNVGVIQGRYPDVYIFNEALSNTTFSKIQLGRVVGALKTYYGIV